MRDVLKRYWPVFLGAALLFPHARLFDFVNDDAYISFRYARNLAEHGQLVFNLGERVEGYTNFLWTVLLAGCLKLGWAAQSASRFFGVAFGVSVLAVVVRLSLRLDGERSRPGHAIAPLLLAATGAFACWCTGGLETQLFTLLTLLAVDRYLDEAARGRGVASGVWFALAAMTRPEGVFFFALAGLHRLLTNIRRERRLRPRRHELLWVAAFAAVFVPYFIWRWRYFGWLLPNTFYVKSSGGAGTLGTGVYYLRRFSEDYEFLLFLPVFFFGRPAADDARRRAFWSFTALFAVGFSAYVVKVGGDFMGLYRFLVPALPLVAICVQESLRASAARLVPVVGRVTVAVAGLAIAVGFAAASVRVSREAVTFIGDDGGIDTPGYLKKYADDRVHIGRWFGQHVRPDDLMTVGGAGVIPYYAGGRAYDVFGLVDQTIAHDPAMTVSTRPGHQKWGSDGYMLSRRPTLVTHVYQIHGGAASPPPAAAFWIQHGYEWVTATIPGLSPPHYSFLKRRDRAFGPFPARGI